MSVKNDMLNIIDDMHWQLEQNELELRKKIKELDEKNKISIEFYADNRKFWFRQIVEYMMNGLAYEAAKQLLFSENKLDSKHIEKVFKNLDYERKATLLFAKIYAIKAMKEAGFTNKKIAEVLKISAATVARLLKCNLKI